MTADAAARVWTDHGDDDDESNQGIRQTIGEPARLLKLNHERYAEEVAQGLHEKGRSTKGEKRAKKPATRGRQAKSSPAEPSLFGDDSSGDG